MSVEDTDWSAEVLHFWFEELTKKDWFMGSETLDDNITSRFAATHNSLSQKPDLPADADQDWALAAVIVLDQFSRNMFRGTKEAFAFDKLALHFAKQARQRGFDQTLSDDQKLFLSMPFLHSEILDDQKTGLQIHRELGRPEHAQEHMDVIERFGRFPHRNQVLGRTSTAEETVFLKDARRYGQ